jgi:hypothetical protein
MSTDFNFYYFNFTISNYQSMAKPRQTKGNRIDADLSHSIRNTIFTITTLPPL